MKKYEVEIAPVVFDEINSVMLFIAKDSVVEALKWAEGIEEKIQSLDAYPYRCPIADESEHFSYDLHHLLIGHYRILYRIDGETVKVLHVLNDRMER